MHLIHREGLTHRVGVLGSYLVAALKFRAKHCLLVCVLAVAAPLFAADFYVAPDGHRDGTGTKNAPWDLQTALNQPSVVRPGDTIWLRAGDYRPLDSASTGFKSELGGSVNRPIVVRQLPGERATLREVEHFTGSDNARQTILYVFGSNTWFWGFEVAGSCRKRIIETSGSDPTPSELPLPSGVEVVGPNIKLIDLVVHDARGGLGLWAAATNCETYGCLIYNNGWTAPDRGHGHGIYTQNLNGTKQLIANIVFNNFGMGIHGYTVNSFLQNFDIEQNAIFNNAHFVPPPNVDTGEQILFGGGTTIKHLKIIDNYLYQPLDLHGPMLAPDYSAISNRDVTMTGNYVAGGSGGGNYLVSARAYDSVSFTKNTLYSTNGSLLRLHLSPGYTVDGNAYYGSADANFRADNQPLAFEKWRTETGFDAHSRYIQEIRPPDKIALIPNIYEKERANIVVYNWSLSSFVLVNLSAVLHKGDTYEMHNAQDYFGAPVLAGTYRGKPLKVPMTSLNTAVPNGWMNLEAVPKTGKQFAVFVLEGIRIGNQAHDK